MSDRFRIATEASVDRADWESIRRADPAGNVFQTHPWLAALIASWSWYRLEWITARDGDGSLLGGLPVIVSRRAGVDQRLSLPYGAPSPPLAAGESAAAIRARLLAAWWESAQGWNVVRSHISLMTSPDADPLPDWPGAPGGTTERTHLVDLSPGFDRLWSDSFDGDVRTSCRKAEREGVTICSGRGDADVRELDRLYRAQAAGWSDHTAFPGSFLGEAVNRLGDAATIWRAEHDGETVAAQLILTDGRMATSYLAPNEAKARAIGAPTLLYRTIIESLAKGGVRWLNLGGSRGNAGLERFKCDLGGRPFDYPVRLVEASWFRPLHRLQYRLRGIRT